MDKGISFLLSPDGKPWCFAFEIYLSPKLELGTGTGLTNIKVTDR